MARLRLPELKRFSKAVLDLYFPRAGTAFSSSLFAAVRRLIGCDFYCYAEYAGEINRQRVTWPATAEPTLFDVFDRYLDQLPTLSAIRRLRIDSPVRISDFATLREWHRTDLYNYLFKPKRLSYQLYFLARQESPQLGFALNRSGRDFSDDERDLLELLRPHIVRAYRASKLDLIPPERPMRSGDLVATVDGRILTATIQAQKWMKYYLGYRGLGFLPDAVRDWLRRQNGWCRNELCACKPRLPLRIEHNQTRLVIRIDSAVAASECRLVLHEENVELSPKPLEILGLTAREAEVLLWVSQGKSNEQIARILAMKERTACKHLQNVFAKLCVENRTAAANLALEQLAFGRRS
jgi:DNA-binding CsgD family transcriptional regulator